MHRWPASFKVNRVAVLFDDDLVTRPAMHHVGNQVAHGPRWQEQARLQSRQVGHHLLTEVDRGIFPLLLVSHFRIRHESPHCGCGSGNGVAIEVNRETRRAWHEGSLHVLRIYGCALRRSTMSRYANPAFRAANGPSEQ